MFQFNFDFGPTIKEEFHKLKDSDTVYLIYDSNYEILKVVQYVTLMGTGSMIKHLVTATLPSGDMNKTIPLGLRIDIIEMMTTKGWKTTAGNARSVLNHFDISLYQKQLCQYCDNTGAMPNFNFYIPCVCGREATSKHGLPLKGTRWHASMLDLKTKK